MINGEFHIVRTPGESNMLTHAGLPPVHLEKHLCAACDRPIGELEDGHFTPCGLVLGSDSLAFLCLSCLHPVLKVIDTGTKSC